MYVAATTAPTHYVEVSETLGAGVASLSAQASYLEGLGGGFDPEEFLRSGAASAGATAGCELAVLLQVYAV